MVKNTKLHFCNGNRFDLHTIDGFTEYLPMVDFKACVPSMYPFLNINVNLPYFEGNGQGTDHMSFWSMENLSAEEETSRKERIARVPVQTGGYYTTQGKHFVWES